jgi:ketosteroid isomerase-like protein
MAAQEDMETVRRGYEAFSNGDTAGIVAPWAPNITFHYPGRSAVAGDYSGHDDVLAFLGQLAARSGGTFRLDVHDILATDQHVVVLCRELGERDGRHLDTPASHVWHTDNGKLTELWDVIYDVQGLDEFWG